MKRMSATAFGFALAAAWVAFTGTAFAQGRPLKPVTLVLEWTGFQPQHFGYWIAKDRGWYADQGLDVTIRSSAGSAQAMQLVAGGRAQFGNVASASMVLAAGKKKLPLRMVGLFGQKDSLSMAYFGSSGIKTPKDIQGHRLGMVPGSLASLLWPAFAKVTGINPSKVQIVNWNFRSYYGIFGAKQVAVSGNFTLGSTGQWLFKKRGDIVHQFVFSDYLPILGSGIVVRSDLIQNDPALVRAFVKATQRAWTYLEKDPKKAVPEAAADVHRQFPGTPPAAIIAKYAYQMIPGRMESPATAGKPAGWSSPAEWTRMIALLKTYDKSMTRTPAASELMTNEFVAAGHDDTH